MQGLLGTLRTMQGLLSNACSHAGTPVLLPLPPYKWVPCAHDAKPAYRARPLTCYCGICAFVDLTMIPVCSFPLSVLPKYATPPACKGSNQPSTHGGQPVCGGEGSFRVEWTDKAFFRQREHSSCFSLTVLSSFFNGYALSRFHFVYARFQRSHSIKQ